jgi:hypothetical protein
MFGGRPPLLSAVSDTLSETLAATGMPPVRYDLLMDWFGVRSACRSDAEMPIVQDGPLYAAGACT